MVIRLEPGKFYLHENGIVYKYSESPDTGKTFLTPDSRLALRDMDTSQLTRLADSEVVDLMGIDFDGRSDQSSKQRWYRTHLLEPALC